MVQTLPLVSLRVVDALAIHRALQGSLEVLKPAHHLFGLGALPQLIHTPFGGAVKVSGFRVWRI